MSRLLSNLSLSDVTQCNFGDIQNCMQKFDLVFTKGSASDACVALQGAVAVRLFLECSSGYGSGCPVTNQSIVINVILATGDACPVTEQVRFSAALLTGEICKKKRHDTSGCCSLFFHHLTHSPALTTTCQCRL